MSDHKYAFEVNESNFDVAVLQNSQQLPVLVDFWADWCAPCKMLMPVLLKLSDEYAGKFLLAKVNSDEQQALAARYGVRSLPTVMLFRHGEVVDQFMGAQPESVVREMLDRHVERDSDRQRARAYALLEAGDRDGAEALLRQALADDPDNPRVAIDLLELLIESRSFDAAQSLIDTLPAKQRESEPVRALQGKLQLARASADGPDEAALRQRIEANDEDYDAHYRLAVQRLAQGDYETGLEQLLKVLGHDIQYDNGQAKKTMLDAFEQLGNSGELVSRYRRQLASLLY